MKRIQAACICQTLRFSLKEEMDPVSTAKLIREEVEHYKKNLNRSGAKYKILDEAQQPDGSMLVRVIKQYNSSPVGDYL